MPNNKSRSVHSRTKLILLVACVAVAAFVLLLAVIMNATSSSETVSIDGDTYAAEVAAVLNGAEAGIGEKLIAETDCAACHLTGAGRTAPLFAGIASAAEGRRPPLSAAQYLYEAIVLPAAHVVDGYADAMPKDYAQRFSPADLGHMIAYLLTLADPNDE